MPPPRAGYEPPMLPLKDLALSCLAVSERNMRRSAVSSGGLISAVPRSSGTYILEMHLEKPVTISVGRLGRFLFARGSYLYVGSARGSGGLRGRIAHHLRRTQRPHWHIDYLRRATTIERILFSTTRRNDECPWSHRLASLTRATIPAEGFGSSDCGCPSHLLYLGTHADQGFADLIC